MKIKWILNEIKNIVTDTIDLSKDITDPEIRRMITDAVFQVSNMSTLV